MSWAAVGNWQQWEQSRSTDTSTVEVRHPAGGITTWMKYDDSETPNPYRMESAPYEYEYANTEQKRPKVKISYGSAWWFEV
eukprot:scaffold614174_cov26-Prasinocladus_malaysianus.AAC.1